MLRYEQGTGVAFTYMSIALIQLLYIIIHDKNAKDY